MRALPWPRNADEYRVKALKAAKAIRKIADDMTTLNEHDRVTIEMALAQIKVHATDIDKWLCLAKTGELEEY